MVALSGGAGLEAYLAKLGREFGSASHVDVGFLEGSSYPDGTPTAMVAAIQNFGAPSRGIPPRPFFSNTIAKNADGWGPALAQNLRETGDARVALGHMGEDIKGQIQTEIVETNSPPLKPATIKRKGFDKPLIEHSIMINAVDYRVD